MNMLEVMITLSIGVIIGFGIALFIFWNKLK